MPTAIKLVKGETKKSRLNPDEPKFRAVAPLKPGFLNKAAEMEWDMLVPALVDAGVLTELDGSVLKDYCDEFAELERLKRFRARQKLGSEGYRRVATSIHQSSARKRALMTELGLTPSARTRIKANPREDKHDPWNDV